MTGPRADSVARSVRRALVSARALVAVEALFLAAAGTALILAAAAVSGAPPRSGLGPWAVGLLGGAAAGLAWWFANRVSEAAFVRTLDGKLSQSGALLAAWEVERGGTPTNVGRLLVARVARGVSAARLVRVGVPVRAFAPAASFLAVALLVVSLEDTRRADAQHAARLSGGAARHLARARDLALDAAGTGELDAERAGELIRLAGRAAELERGLAAGTEQLESVEAELLALDSALERLSSELAAEPELAAALTHELAEARAFGDAARAALRPDRDPLAVVPGGEVPGGEVPGGEVPGGELEGSDSERSGAERADSDLTDPELAGSFTALPGKVSGTGAANLGSDRGESSPRESGESRPGLALTGPDGTMSDPRPSNGPGHPAERAALTVRSWPREYDGVVEAWLRAGRAGRPGADDSR